MIRWFDGCRWLWNQAIEHNQNRWAAHAGVENATTLAAAIPPARQIPNSPLTGVPGTWAQGTLKQQGDAWALHWSKWKAGKESSPPRFRSHTRAQSVRFAVQEKGQPATPCYLTRSPESGSLRFSEVRIVKLGWVRFRNDRDEALPADALCGSMVVRLDELGRWWVLFQCEIPAPHRETTGMVAGVDRGVVHSLVTDDGRVFDVPGMTPGEARRRRKLERSMARSRRLNPCPGDHWETVNGRAKLIYGHCECEPGGCWKQSKRYQRTKTAVAKIRDREVQRRNDATHKASAVLAAENDLVVFEDLEIQNMIRSAKGTEDAPGRNVAQKTGLNRSIAAQAWGDVKKKTGDKTRVEVVPAAYSSQTCAECGHVDKASRVSQALFCCTNCGHEDNADRNAARVIRQRGIDLLAGESPSPAVTQTVAGRGGDRIERPDEPSTIITTQEESCRTISVPGTGGAVLAPLVPGHWGLNTHRCQPKPRRGRKPRPVVLALATQEVA